MLKMWNIYLEGWELQSWCVKRLYIPSQPLEVENLILYIEYVHCNRFWIVLLWFPSQFLFISHYFCILPSPPSTSPYYLWIPLIWCSLQPSEGEVMGFKLPSCWGDTLANPLGESRLQPMSTPLISGSFRLPNLLVLVQTFFLNKCFSST